MENNVRFSLRKLLTDSGINKADIIEKFVRSSGKGGQNVNKVSTCVYLKHLPTGIEVKFSSARTQGENRSMAWQLLIQKIIDFRQSEIRKSINEAEKHRRRTRLKPKSLKEKILGDKKVHSEKKKLRKKVMFKEVE